MNPNKYKPCPQDPGFYQNLICVEKGCNQLLCLVCVEQHCIEHKKSNTSSLIKSLDKLKKDQIQAISETFNSLNQVIQTILNEENKTILASLDQAQEEAIAIVNEFFGNMKEEANFELESMEQWKKNLIEKSQEYEALCSSLKTEEANTYLLQQLAERDLNKELDDILVVHSRSKILALKRPLDLKDTLNYALSEFAIYKKQKDEKKATEKIDTEAEENNSIIFKNLLNGKGKKIEEEDMDDHLFKNSRIQKIVQHLLFSSNNRHPNIEIVQDRHTIIRTEKKMNEVNICLGGWLLNKGFHSFTMEINSLENNEKKNWLAFGFIPGNKNLMLNQSVYEKGFCVCSNKSFQEEDGKKIPEVSAGVVYTLEVDFLDGKVLITGENGLRRRWEFEKWKGLLPFWEFKGDHRVLLLNYDWLEY